MCVNKQPYWLSLEEFIFGGPNSFIARYTDKYIKLFFHYHNKNITTNEYL